MHWEEVKGMKGKYIVNEACVLHRRSQLVSEVFKEVRNPTGEELFR